MQVKVIRIDGDAALVEYVSGEEIHRMIIPIEEIQEGEADLSILEQGIPYGDPWENLTPQVTGAMIANSLRKVGVWTKEDARRNPRLVISALQAAYSVDLTSILNFETEA